MWKIMKKVSGWRDHISVRGNTSEDIEDIIVGSDQTAQYVGH